MKLSRRTLLSTPLAVVAPVGEVAGVYTNWKTIECSADTQRIVTHVDVTVTLHGKMLPTQSVKVTCSSNVLKVVDLPSDWWADRVEGLER